MSNPEHKIRLSKSVVGGDEKDAIARVMDGGYLGMGQEVKLFEQEIKDFLDTSREVVCVNTGTSALQLALQGLGIGLNDEVLVPSLTYVASFQAIAATGAIPVSCDVKIENGFVDVTDAAKKVTPRTRAIMPVHYASNSSEMENVFEFAKKIGIRVIEDAAHSFGCSRNGRKIGSFGDVTVFSFDGIKNITSGEGGAVVSNDTALINNVKDIRLLGVEKDTEKRYSGNRSWNFDVSQQGWRYHMSNIMAAIGRAQLRKIELFGTKRRNIATKYAELLEDFNEINLLDINFDNTIPHIFPIRVLNGKRDFVWEKLHSRGIECGFHYFPNHKLEYFKSKGDFPVSEQLGLELLSLPLHPEVTDRDQQRILSELTQIIN